MADVLFVCLMVGGGLALLGTVVLAVAATGQYLAERRLADGAERRQFTRVPCVFRADGAPPGAALWEGDLSLGGACVKMPTAAPGRRLKVVAVDPHGLAPATKVEGRVVSMQRQGDGFVHHVAFDQGFDDVTVSALVASAVWAEPAL